jgi:hypothetical protein
MIRIKAQILAESTGFSPSDAPDIAQELTIQLLQEGPGLVPRTASMKTLVDRVLSNKIRNVVHHNQAQMRDRRRNEQLEEATPVCAIHGRDSSRQLDLALDLKEALASLPEELYVLAQALKKMTPAMAMRELGLTRGQLRQRMSQLEKHLREKNLAPSQPFSSRLLSVTREDQYEA